MNFYLIAFQTNAAIIAGMTVATQLWWSQAVANTILINKAVNATQGR